MKVTLKTRERATVGALAPGQSFVASGGKLFTVIDLTSDIFREGASLRNDVIYVVEMSNGVANAFPRSTEVEVVEVEVSEI